MPNYEVPLDHIEAAFELRGPLTLHLPDPPPPPERMRIGWCPGLRPGESDVTATRRMLAAYPGSEYGALRLFFQPGEDFGDWDSGVLPEVPPSADVVISGKTWPTDVPAWLDAMPQRTGRTWLCLYHEPEQGPAKGDPPPDVYKRQWTELAAAVRGHPRRAELGLMPIYTRFYWKAHPDAYEQFFPTAALSDLDAVGFDVYDQLGRRTGYEAPESMLRVPLDIAARAGLPLAVCELGIRRLDSTDRAIADVHGLAAAAQLRAVIDSARTAGVLGVMWYHNDLENHHDLLTDPVRAAESATLATLIADQEQ